jgi:hypothetical protein
VLLFVIPLVGWGMLPAARFPIAMFGSVHLFPILPHNVMLYAILRKTHTYLAYLLFFAFISHFGAVWFHSLILRDGLFNRIALWRDFLSKDRAHGGRQLDVIAWSEWRGRHEPNRDEDGKRFPG